jgi:hypothetical protein
MFGGIDHRLFLLFPKKSSKQPALGQGDYRLLHRQRRG